MLKKVCKTTFLEVLRMKAIDLYRSKFNKTEFQSFEATSINLFEKSIEKPILNLPFLKNAKYQILQGYNSPFSHNLLNNKFAIDIQMPVETQICAAADGVVVQYVKDYEKGGIDLKWKGFDNYIWIYHPQWNVISSYAHLKQNGVLVKVGDFVKANQPIALSGNTGYSTEPHLHFHVLKINDEMQYESIPFDFLEGYSGFDLKKGAFVKK
jgi:murein DD-endopeptidase MepM/ murein hydrolase activator NlpD